MRSRRRRLARQRRKHEAWLRRLEIDARHLLAAALRQELIGFLMAPRVEFISTTVRLVEST